MGLYEAIFTRKSVRKFSPEPVSSELLGDISAFLDGIDQLPGGSVELELAGPDAVTDSSAPHYVLAWCRPEDAEYINVGYVMQAADLYIRSLGLGAHWKAMPRLTSRTAEHPGGLRYSNLLAFGTPNEPMRAGEADFRRLPIGTISNADNAVARAARLAPSGLNDQPWTLEFDGDLIRVTQTPRGAFRLMTGRSDKLSMGILVRHLTVALDHEGTPVRGIDVDVSGKHALITVHLDRG
jgi:nitroreductase